MYIGIFNLHVFIINEYAYKDACKVQLCDRLGTIKSIHGGKHQQIGIFHLYFCNYKLQEILIKTIIKKNT